MTTQTWNPSVYLRDAGFVPALGAPLIDLLAPVAGEHILDVGCGDGTLTEKIQAAGCRVVGIDSSPEQIAAACARGLDAHVLDAHRLRYHAAFDAVFSNAALHWMLAPSAVLAGIARALKPAGRFVGEMGGAGNVDSVVTAYAAEFAARELDVASHNPWFFPGVDEYRALLEAAGFEVRAIELFARPTPLPGDVADWLRLMTQPFLAAVPVAAQPQLLAAVRERLRERVLGPDGRWELDYVRLRFSAVKRGVPA